MCWWYGWWVVSCQYHGRTLADAGSVSSTHAHHPAHRWTPPVQQPIRAPPPLQRPMRGQVACWGEARLLWLWPRCQSMRWGGAGVACCCLTTWDMIRDMISRYQSWAWSMVTANTGPGLVLVSPHDQCMCSVWSHLARSLPKWENFSPSIKHFIFDHIQKTEI